MKVSIVTATYNDVKHLQKSLTALLEQDYDNIESIIVDGGSTDCTVKVIQDFKDQFKGTVKWVSEKDKGLYDAANKGIRMATGDIIGCYWDVFADNNVISEIVQRISEENTDGVHGDLVYVDGEQVVRYWKMGQGKIKRGWMPGHPTLYLKKEVYEKYGLYKENYRCSGDYEFMVRCLKDESVKLSYIPKVMIRMFYGGLSTSSKDVYRRSIKEGIIALKENHVKHPYWVTFLRILVTSRQFFNCSRKLAGNK